MRGEWKAPATLSRTHRRTPRARAVPSSRSTAVREPETTIWVGEFQLATHRTSPPRASATIASTCGDFRPDQGEHGPRRGLGRLLHEPPPQGHDLEGFLPVQAAREYEGRVLAQAQAAGCRRGQGASESFLQGRDHGHAVEEDRHLAHVGPGELLLGALADDPDEVAAREVAPAAEESRDFRGTLDQVDRHPDRLRPLPGKKEGPRPAVCLSHRITYHCTSV